VDLIAAPEVYFEFAAELDGNFCAGADINLLNLSTAGNGTEIVSQQWEVADSNGMMVYTSQELNPILHFDQADTYFINLTVWNECGCSSSYEQEFNLEGSTVEIECPTVSCEDRIETYSIDTSVYGCGEFIWDVLGGQIVSDPSLSEIDVLWNNVDQTGFGYVSFNATGCDVPCGDWSTVRIPVVTQQGTITNQTELCPDEQYVYSLPQWPTTDFNWILIDGFGNDITNTSNSGNTTFLMRSGQRNEAIIDTHSLPAGDYTIRSVYENTLHHCGGSASLQITVGETLSISAPDKICGENLIITPSVTNVPIDYTYIVNDILITQTRTGPLTIMDPEAGSTIITATAGGYCESNPIFVEVSSPPERPESLVGSPNYELPDEVCENEPYTITFDNPVGGTGIIWESTAPSTIQLSSPQGTFSPSSVTYNGNGWIDLSGIAFTRYPGNTAPIRLIVSVWHAGEELCSYAFQPTIASGRPGESGRFAIQPNPVNDKFTATYTIFDGKAPQKVVMQLRDMRGLLLNEVSLLPAEARQAGLQKENSDETIEYSSGNVYVESLIPGNYIAILLIDGKRVSEEILIKK
jgi:hypothetical protein